MNIQRATRAARAIANHITKWPDDEWVAIAPDWDLNLWTDEESGVHGATLYPVKNGNTDTKKGITIK